MIHSAVNTRQEGSRVEHDQHINNTHDGQRSFSNKRAYSRPIVLCLLERGLLVNDITLPAKNHT